MNNKINGTSLYTSIQFGQFKFLKMLYTVIQTELLQEPVFAHCWGYPPFPLSFFGHNDFPLTGGPTNSANLYIT